MCISILVPASFVSLRFTGAGEGFGVETAAEGFGAGFELHEFNAVQNSAGRNANTERNALETDLDLIVT